MRSINDRLYIMEHNGNVYWGRFTCVPGYGWAEVYRRAPMKRNHWYVSGRYTFGYHLYSGNIAIGFVNDDAYVKLYPLSLNEIVYLDDRKLVHPIKKFVKENREYHSCFDNRLREYGDSHFVPMQKRLKGIV